MKIELARVELMEYDYDSEIELNEKKIILKVITL